MNRRSIRYDPKVIDTVVRLRRDGLSQREIAERLGLARPTIQRILRAAGMTKDGPGRPQQTHCKHGHPLDENNVYVRPSNGTRHCLICKRERAEQWRRERGMKPLAEEYALRSRRMQRKLALAPLPMEVRSIWAKAAPGSQIRRMFPSTRDLASAVWDPERGMLRRNSA